VLSLISLNDGVKDAFRETPGAFEALAVMLGRALAASPQEDPGVTPV